MTLEVLRSLQPSAFSIRSTFSPAALSSAAVGPRAACVRRGGLRPISDDWPPRRPRSLSVPRHAALDRGRGDEAETGP